MHTQTFTHTFAATATGVQKRFVNFAGAQAIATDPVLGVAVTDFVTGQPTTAHILGAVYVEAGGAIAAGDPIIPDASGRAVKDTGTATNRCGRALSTVTAAGQFVFLLLK